MAIRQNKEEIFVVSGSLEEWLGKSEKALKQGNFTSVAVNRTISQLTANYKKLTVWGEIVVTLLPEGDKVRIHANSNANADNIFPLLSNPNKKILSQFKNNL